MEYILHTADMTLLKQLASVQSHVQLWKQLGRAVTPVGERWMRAGLRERTDRHDLLVEVLIEDGERCWRIDADEQLLQLPYDTIWTIRLTASALPSGGSWHCLGTYELEQIAILRDVLDVREPEGDVHYELDAALLLTLNGQPCILQSHDFAAAGLRLADSAEEMLSVEKAWSLHTNPEDGAVVMRTERRCIRL